MNTTIAVLLLLAAAITLILYLRTRKPRTLEAAKSLLGDQLDELGKTVTVDGVEFHYVQMGRGPDLVLLHGIGASLFTWRYLIPPLARHHRVTAFDLAGFGRSTRAGSDYGLDTQAAQAQAFLDTVGVKRATLIGSSMGGTVALWMSKQNPLRFAEVIALAPATDPRRVPRLAAHLQPFIPVFGHVLNRHTMRLILHTVIGNPDAVDDEVVERYLHPYRDRRAALDAFWGALKLLQDPRLPNDLEGLQARILILYGQRDSMVSQRSIDRLHKLLPQAEVRMHPHGGHHIMEGEPDWTLERIREFLESKD